MERERFLKIYGLYYALSKVVKRQKITYSISI